MKKNINNIAKIGFILMILVMIILFINGCFFSSSSASIINPDDYKPTDNTGSQKLSNIAGVVLGAINVVGAFISAGMLMIIGIKYMIGSVEEKAEYKSTMLPYVIGAVLLFSGTTLLNLIYNLATII